ncbi:MAG: lipopolysaccharide biosynthesis protein, partial [Candidatus Heimdallarchaeota archaeon]
SKSKTAILTYKSRISETNKLLKQEIKRLKRNINTEAELAELTRDYEVNRDMYTSLLTRRERANISMNLGKESTGPSFIIQEPARLPLVPSGFRFFHFMAAGILLGLIIPIGLIYLLVNFDPRVRSPILIEEKLNIPVLVSIPAIRSANEIASNKVVNRVLMFVFSIIFLLYIFAGISKFTGGSL